jgi:hypothetical protein
MFEKPNLKVYFKSSEGYGEIANNSVDLLVGDSLHIDFNWENYKQLFSDIYVRNAKRVLKDTGVFLTKITDSYHKGMVFPRGKLLLDLLLPEYKLIDIKIWKRRVSNDYQSPFSYFYVFVKSDNKMTRDQFHTNGNYRIGVWDYPEKSGGKLNAWNDDLCKFVIDCFTKEGDTILDPLAGTCRLLVQGAKVGRVCYGYEKEASMEEEIMKVWQTVNNEKRTLLKTD